MKVSEFFNKLIKQMNLNEDDELEDDTTPETEPEEEESTDISAQLAKIDALMDEVKSLKAANAKLAKNITVVETKPTGGSTVEPDVEEMIYKLVGGGEQNNG